MNNKPKIKDIVIYSHPIIGDVSLNDFIRTLRYFIETVKKYETVSMNLLKHYNIDDEIYISLFPLLVSSSCESILDDLEDNIE